MDQEMLMEKVEIRRAKASDAEPLSEIYGTQSVLRETLLLPFPSPQSWLERVERGTDVTLVAEIDQKVVGNAALHLHGIRRRLHAASISIGVHADWHRRGVGSALMRALIDLADDYMQLTRLELTVFAQNHPAIALYEKFGFFKEGLMRQHAMREGKLSDGLVMARLKSSVAIIGLG